jgi:hypothetical protein
MWCICYVVVPPLSPLVVLIVVDEEEDGRTKYNIYSRFLMVVRFFALPCFLDEERNQNEKRCENPVFQF